MEKKPIKISLKMGIILSLIVIIFCMIILTVIMFKIKNNNNEEIYVKKDDWEFDAKQVLENRNVFSGIAKGFSPSSVTGSATMDSAVSSETTNGRTIGF